MFEFDVICSSFRWWFVFYLFGFIFDFTQFHIKMEMYETRRKPSSGSSNNKQKKLETERICGFYTTHILLDGCDVDKRLVNVVCLSIPNRNEFLNDSIWFQMATTFLFMSKEHNKHKPSSPPPPPNLCYCLCFNYWNKIIHQNQTLSFNTFQFKRSCITIHVFFSVGPLFLFRLIFI